MKVLLIFKYLREKRTEGNIEILKLEFEVDTDTKIVCHQPGVLLRGHQLFDCFFKKQLFAFYSFSKILTISLKFNRNADQFSKCSIQFLKWVIEKRTFIFINLPFIAAAFFLFFDGPYWNQK